MGIVMFNFLRFVFNNRRHELRPVRVERRGARPMNCREANVALSKAVERLKRAVYEAKE